MNPIDRLRLSLGVFTAKTVTAIIRASGKGAASVLPGTIASRFHPRILSLLTSQIKYGTIVVGGTNGKTTTSLLLRKMLEADGKRVIHNEAGANLVNGLVTTLLSHANLLGSVKADYAILEVDENVIPLVLEDIKPKYFMGLNLFRDQLDRYGEVDAISHKWGKVLGATPSDTTLILNGDDPALYFLGKQLQTAQNPKQSIYFGLNEPDLYLDGISHASDSIYCPSCGHALDYKGTYIAHQGDYTCPACGFNKPKPMLESKEWPQVLIGVYNKYNTLAATTAATALGLPKDLLIKTIDNFQAAFGRAEEIEYRGKKVRIILTKNPVGMNETIRAVNRVKQQGGGSVTLMVLNDRTPDGTDVSWIWDVDTEKFVNSGGTIVVSGDRVYDMALRLEYSKETTNSDCRLIVEENLAKAIDKAIDLTPVGETLHIVPTYSAMLEVREKIAGRKIL
jgi:lipid II isoglutaminyl synthase (glutamine-hydrolysing)